MSRRLMLIALLPLTLTACIQRFDPSMYPETPRHDRVDTLHGQSIADPYRWLEDEQSEAAQEWITAQNTLTERALAPFHSTREEIAAELTALYGVDSVSNIRPAGERYFFTMREHGQNHSVIRYWDAKWQDQPFAAGKVAINPNEFSADGTVALDWWFPSPNGRYITYGKSSSGSEKSTLYIRDVTTGQDLADEIPHTQYCNVAWNADGTGFYYNRCPDPATVPAGEENFHMRVYFHRVGTDWQQDRYVWGKGRPIDEEPRPYASSDGQYVLLNFFKDPSVDDLYIKWADDEQPFQSVSAGLNAITHGDVAAGRLYLLTNHQAPRYRICVTSVDKPGPEHWTTIVPEQKGVIDAFDIVDGKLVVRLSENVRSRLIVYDLDGHLMYEIPLPGLGTVTSMRGGLDKPDLFFTFASWVVPTVVYHYDLRTRQSTVLHRTESPVDLSQFETTQIWATSEDGTRVPIFVVARKDIVLDGSNPTLLYGYGGFNNSFFPYYRPRIVPFLERGGVWALANIRGGGEFGQPWHDGGRRELKQNCFNDFYAAGERLIELGYTNPSRLACKGGSNGGLLIGAAVTQRPDLFQAALSQVPLMDMLRFHLWGMGAQWVHEYGDPEKPAEFAWLRAYSPYHNIDGSTDYPATLIVTAEADNRVDTAHAFKMTAALQHATSGTRPILLRCERKAGHGAGKPLNMRIAHQSEDWTFLMWQLGMID